MINTVHFFKRKQVLCKSHPEIYDLILFLCCNNELCFFTDNGTKFFNLNNANLILENIFKCCFVKYLLTPCSHNSDFFTKILRIVVLCILQKDAILNLNGIFTFLSFFFKSMCSFSFSKLISFKVI